MYTNTLPPTAARIDIKRKKTELKTSSKTFYSFWVMVNVSCFGRCKKKSPAWCGCDGWEKKSCKRSYASDALIHWSIGWVGERIESRFNDAHQDDECLQRGTHRSTWKAIYYCCLYCISIYPYSKEAAAFHHRTVFPPMLLKTYIPQESSKNIQAQVEVWGRFR